MAGSGQGLGSCSAAPLSLQLLEVNKQWDQHFRATKQKYEQKVRLGAQSWVLKGHVSSGCWETWRRPAVGGGFGAACASFPPSAGPSRQANVPTPSRQVTDLHQELAEARRALTELESEREQKQRDFDRKLLLAKSRIETEEVSPLGRAAGSCWPRSPALADLRALDPAGREGEVGHGGQGPAAEDAVPAGAAGPGHQAAGVPGEGDPEAEQGGGQGKTLPCKMSFMFSVLSQIQN